MRQLLNTLFVLSADNYLSLDGENVVVSCDKQERVRFAFAHSRGNHLFHLRRRKSCLNGCLCTARH